MFGKNKNSNKYKIEGISCTSCKQTILMDLEEAGFADLKINDENELLVPEKSANEIEEIKKIISDSGKYKLI